MKVGILGATGYTGHELVRLLNVHPEAELIYLGSSSSAGKGYETVYPHFEGFGKGYLQTEDVPELDVLFCALPHGLTAARAKELLDRQIKVIDLGADFRLKDPDSYKTWYRLDHPVPELLAEAVYGLPEVYREEIGKTSLVANPGCYPTATLLALIPLLESKLIKGNSLIIDAKSGVSGAGRGASLNTHFAEVTENFKAYGIAEHRHTPEIEQELSRAAGSALTVSFTPHLVPMIRGILTTIYADVEAGVGEDDLRACWNDHYSNEEFIRVLPKGTWPQTKFCTGSNYVYLQLTLDKRTGRAVIVSAIDNLVKGASGQAIQNMNIMYGLPENYGLKGTAIWP
ncbi:MAG: N-acetyl-gamma-glutamyl-phosphate reductase [Desulfitobacterium hafniense]|nr:N-acetyl-gamma-glutamyl-phosphate reductase [Desulfitobacterium hafniense]